MRKDGKALSLGQAAAASAFVEAQSRIRAASAPRNDLEKLRSCRNALQKLVDCGAGSESAWDSRTKSWMRDRGNRRHGDKASRAHAPDREGIAHGQQAGTAGGAGAGAHADADLDHAGQSCDGQGEQGLGALRCRRRLWCQPEQATSRSCSSGMTSFLELLLGAANTRGPVGKRTSLEAMTKTMSAPLKTSCSRLTRARTNERLVAVKREVLCAERSARDDRCTSTAQKSEPQQLVSDAARALIDADVPTHECPDDDTPFYLEYSSRSTTTASRRSPGTPRPAAP